jgi:hypothetical protein
MASTEADLLEGPLGVRSIRGTKTWPRDSRIPTQKDIKCRNTRAEGKCLGPTPPRRAGVPYAAAPLTLPLRMLFKDPTGQGRHQACPSIERMTSVTCGSARSDDAHEAYTRCTNALDDVLGSVVSPHWVSMDATAADPRPTCRLQKWEYLKSILNLWQ